MSRVRQYLRRRVCVSAAVALTLAISMGHVHADPAADALARLNELSSQALQTREAVTAAQRDAEARRAEQTAAEDRHRADLDALTAANAQLAPYQAAVDRIAAMNYMSGRDGQMAALLTAPSPQQLIDRLSLQRVVAATTADQMKAYKAASERAAAAAVESEKSAADARAAAERAAAVGAELQGKWKELLRKIAEAEAQYAALTPQQQAVIDNAVPPPPPPVGAPAPPPPPPGEPASPLAAVVPDNLEALPVGVANEAGLQPNTIMAARAVSARFPQIGDIDGVRPDSKPWHPRGLAIDIMIPNHQSPEGIALGNEILAFAMANAGRFGLQDVIWRGTYYTPAGPQASGYGHFDHVHITTLPR
ncbi:glycoside hydrolase [Mycolicibacterium flavescens]|uniref:Glycoside hydrolase n=1 Tax=Mycolicibacterium flavescens TaxID=1776 RepID=A0A1E3RI43_MYCFV|nr:glycoside hydrolase [Mycolicibacterium flavescens]MCV7282217.1 glycoside hydrolase [Mycolicibacterium flavescens]ODQ89530.1 glycoside hydrolase [Mycolicibacterium flavescens]